MQHDQLICLENGPLPEAEGAGGIGHPFTHGLDRKQNLTRRHSGHRVISQEYFALYILKWKCFFLYEPNCFSLMTRE